MRLGRRTEAGAVLAGPGASLNHRDPPARTQAAGTV